MDVNDNVPVEKKTWWQIYRFKILIPALLSVVTIILFIWIINKNKTIPSQNSIKMMKNQTFFLKFQFRQAPQLHHQAFFVLFPVRFTHIFLP